MNENLLRLVFPAALRLAGLHVRSRLWSGSQGQAFAPRPGKKLLRYCISPYALAVHPRLADITLIAQVHQHEQLLIDIFATSAT